MTNIVLQSFGNEKEYKRAIFAILSYYAHSIINERNDRVLIFTDNPNYFNKYLENLPIEYVHLSVEKIYEMRGKIDFLHRIKIAVIDEAFQISSGIILYIDSDTFFTSDPTVLSSQVDTKTCFMHLLEYPFEREIEDKTETYRNFYELINREHFRLTDGRRLKVTSKHHSWNAGAMFFHPEHACLIRDVYCLTEQFYPASGSHASEQYAFSIVFEENTQIKPCSSVIYHYWYRVKKQIIDIFLKERLNSDWASLPMSEKLAQVKQWTKSLPEHFDSHELMIQDHAVQAFNENRFSEGYKWALKAIKQNPLGSRKFLRDTLYHVKRHLTHK